MEPMDVDMQAPMACRYGHGSTHLTSMSNPKLLWKVENNDHQDRYGLHRPYDVAFLWNNVVVTEGFWPYSRLQVFDMSGKSVRQIGHGEILPFSLCVQEASGRIAVTDHHDRTVKFCSIDGSDIQSWPTSMFQWPDGIAMTSEGYYIITDSTSAQVSIHQPDGRQIRTFKSTDNSSTFSCPKYVTVDHHNRIIVSDIYNHSIKIFNQRGKLLLSFGSHDNGNPQLKDPRGLCIDRYNNIIISDWGREQVLQYSPDGRMIQSLLGKQDGLNNPWGVAVNQQGLLAVSEQKMASRQALKMFAFEHF